MKWNITSTQERNWHEWFAWYPVKTDKNERVWLEKIVRRQKSRDKHWVDWMFLDFWVEYEYKESVFQILRDKE